MTKNNGRRLLFVIALILATVFSGCAYLKPVKYRKTGEKSAPQRTTTTVPAQTRAPEAEADAISAAARRYAREDTPGGRVLAAAVAMIDEKIVVVGACWDYINAVYDRAGYAKDKRETVYKEKETGPFLDPGLIRPGDWVMYRNLPYQEIGHSAIFVTWIDFEKRSALTIEYVGRDRRLPGQYREADLTKSWGLVRGKEQEGGRGKYRWRGNLAAIFSAKLPEFSQRSFHSFLSEASRVFSAKLPEFSQRSFQSFLSEASRVFLAKLPEASSGPGSREIGKSGDSVFRAAAFTINGRLLFSR